MSTLFDLKQTVILCYLVLLGRELLQYSVITCAEKESEKKEEICIYIVNTNNVHTFATDLKLTRHCKSTVDQCKIKMFKVKKYFQF